MRRYREYGGWGIRGGLRGTKAYNVSGNRGVELMLADGRTVLIGSPAGGRTGAGHRFSTRDIVDVAIGGVRDVPARES